MRVEKECCSHCVTLHVFVLAPFMLTCNFLWLVSFSPLCHRPHAHTDKHTLSQRNDNLLIIDLHRQKTLCNPTLESRDSGLHANTLACTVQSDSRLYLQTFNTWVQSYISQQVLASLLWELVFVVSQRINFYVLCVSFTFPLPPQPHYNSFTSLFGRSFLKSKIQISIRIIIRFIAKSCFTYNEQ